MAKQLYTNNAVAPLVASATSGETTLSLGTGYANFASPTGGDYQMATITDGTNIEIVKITARSSTSLTVVRAQEGTTAQAWTADTCTVSARLTAGMLNKIAQNESATTDAVALGNAASTEPPVASGLRSIAIGKNAQATGADSVAVGRTALASAANAAALTSFSTASGVGAVAAGQSAVASGTNSVALGTSTTASNTNSVAVGGTGTVASGARSVAIGLYCNAIASDATAIGYSSNARGSRSLAIGYGSFANGNDSFGANGGYTYAPLTWNIKGHPTIPRDNWWAGAESTADMSGAEGMFASTWVDLGNIPPWATATVYTDGDVVRPSTDNGYQYVLWHGNYSGSAVPNTITTSGSAPSFPTSNYSDVTADVASGSKWIALDVLNGFLLNLPANTVFYPTEFGFVCFKHANVTDAPFVSIGTSGSPNLYVNNQQLSGITGANQIQRLTPAVNSGISGEIQFKLNTKATGTNSQFHGRFYAKGLFIQAQG